MQAKNETFALESPITKITGKDRLELTREDLIKVIVKQQIERLTFHYTAVDGKIKELRIPLANRRQAEIILAEGERLDGSSLFKGIIDQSNSDLYVVPDYKTAFLNPFDETSLNFICRFLTHKGERASFTPDNILNNAANALLKNTGCELQAHSEMEFYLITPKENNLYPIPKQKGYHAAAPYVKTGKVLDEMVKYITHISGHVKYGHHEVGCLDNIESDYDEINGKRAEQVEIEFSLSKIDEAADNTVLAKWIIRNVAYKYGYVATFAPKMEIGHAGNGMHFHLALFKNGKSIMNDKSGKLSNEALKLIGGLCRYAPSLTSFGNMVSASYLRLVPNQEAPTKVCWGERNRSVLIRVPLGWTNVSNLAQKINPQQKDPLLDEPNRQTVELRSPDGSALSHFLLSGATMAADWGLKNEKESLNIAKQSHVSVNVHSSPSDTDLAELSTSCVESAEMLMQHRYLYERDNVFPAEVINYISTTLQNENDKNLNKRLMAMPDDERQKESRRIMHRDIHKH